MVPYLPRYDLRFTSGGNFTALGLSLAFSFVLLSFLWLELEVFLIEIVGIIGIGFIIFAFAQPLYALCVWIVLAPVGDNFIHISLGAGIPDLTFTRIIAGTIFIVLLLQSIFKMREILPITKIESAMLLFSGFALLSTVRTTEFTQNIQILLDGYIIPFCLFFLLKNLISGPNDVKKILSAYIVASIYLAGLGIFQYFTDTSLLTPQDFTRTHADRASGPFQSAVEYGMVMAIMAIGTFWLFSLQRSDLKKIIVGLMLLLQAAAITFSLTRAVWGGFAIALMLIGHRIKRFRFLMVLIPLAGVFGVMFMLLLADENSSLKERSVESGPIYSRLTLYGTALRTVAASPLIGHGFGIEVFYESSREYLTTLSGVSDSFGTNLTKPHNEFLHMLVMLGLVGFVLYLLVFIYASSAGKRLYSTLDKAGSRWREGAVFASGVMFIYVLNILMVDVIVYPYVNSIFYSFLGIIAAMDARKKRYMVKA